nr:MAG TPA: hypothetical protein [Caudoviricetes sp.]
MAQRHYTNTILPAQLSNPRGQISKPLPRAPKRPILGPKKAIFWAYFSTFWGSFYCLFRTILGNFGAYFIAQKCTFFDKIRAFFDEISNLLRPKSKPFSIKNVP